MMIVRTFVLSAALALLAGPMMAESPFDGAIKARKALMTLNAFTIGQLAAIAKGDVPYDAQAAQAIADDMVGIIALDRGAFWPAGSDNGAVEGTSALPAIWAEGSDILEKVAAWNEATLAMQAAAGKDLASLQGAMEALGGACAGCHKAFVAAN